MAEVTAAMVKELRDDTGLGMMDCKKALDEANGDIQAAKDALRAKGLTTAEKKAGRATKEGLVAIKIAPDKSAASMVEIQCETDFCARNEEFQKMVHILADQAYEKPAGKVESDENMTDALQQTLAKIGENMQYSKGVKVEAAKVGSYLHHNSKVGVIAGVDKAVDDEILSDLCMHIAFSDPMGITPDDIPAELVAKEKDIAKQQAIESGKPAEIAEKMVEGKMRKFLEERALMEQLIAREDKYGKKKVKEVLGDAKVVDFARFAVGE
jgi:elongation factor Ts